MLVVPVDQLMGELYQLRRVFFFVIHAHDNLCHSPVSSSVLIASGVDYRVSVAVVISQVQRERVLFACHESPLAKVVRSDHRLI